MNQHIDTAAKGVLSAGAAGGILVWGLQLPEWAAVTSIFVALIGLLVHVWAAARKDRRAEEAHRAYLEATRAHTPTVESGSPKGSEGNSEG